MHITPIQLRFNDIDQMGHVNNAVIMEFFDLGKSEYFTAIGLPPEEGEFTVMVVHVEVDFQRQIRYHDKIHVTTTVDHFGKKSLAMKQQVINTDTGLHLPYRLVRLLSQNSSVRTHPRHNKRTHPAL